MSPRIWGRGVQRDEDRGVGGQYYPVTVCGGMMDNYDNVDYDRAQEGVVATALGARVGVVAEIRATGGGRGGVSPFALVVSILTTSYLLYLLGGRVVREWGR